MLRITELRLPLGHAPEDLRTAILARAGIHTTQLQHFRIARRSHDARKRHAIQLVYTIDAEIDGATSLPATPDTTWRPPVTHAPPGTPRPIVIGTGPCGLFAALALSQMGLPPLILDRGKPVRERTKDTWALWRRGILTPESNVQFGEGGAGTFSDGKLYSQIKDRLHHGRKVLEDFVTAGAPEEILWLSKPHIGTFRLVQVVESLRARIEAMGGEYRWQSRVERLTLAPDRHVTGVTLSTGEHIPARHVVLAIGHSARDTFAALHAQGVSMDAKPLSIGVRIEHPQGLIDRARFGPAAGNPTLGAADYKLVHHASNGRSVYSFCMCPGGTVVAAASEPGRLVTNGMSQYSRAERNANAALVVSLTPADFPDASPLGGMEFQRHWEERAFAAGGRDYRAPAQTVGDFLAGRPSTSLGSVTPSYKPGVTPTSLADCLPDYAVAALREALPAFGKQIMGFDAAEAVMTGVETRTSSPLRIGRGAEFVSLNTPGLYPAGEGAGYAGGILSAAVDGIRVAEALACAAVGVEVPVERRWRGGEVQGWG
ncbi:NAD(P)/FAD-dependent oxidoreductase [Plastoroseomonas arctica]|uniref:FAD-dependent oxidoreductase n=1 Tax=Plastoroseomonas arctica TaxID=1509237 RepID=A0AAF1JXJ8_9PROT|nr:FAD-dependent oxidoreductase [Plastoroseomonas arctica]MBR0656257.1 FAD-dependent oxidoreductase [Plastoroseomonas arctica]